MNKMLKTLLYLIAVVSILIGFNAFRIHNNIFHESLAYCCESGECENIFVSHGAKCYGTSSVHILPNCNSEITFTCADCVDYTYSHCICFGGSHYCINDDSTFYYGKAVYCERTDGGKKW